jgi:hypothetical protein
MDSLLDTTTFAAPPDQYYRKEYPKRTIVQGKLGVWPTSCALRGKVKKVRSKADEHARAVRRDVLPIMAYM